MTTVGIAPLAKQQFNQNGVPLAGGKLFTYAAGTTNKQSSYTSSSGATPNTNPIILDSNGQCDLWLTQNLGYKLVLAPAWDTDPPASPYWTEDNIQSVAPVAVGNMTDELGSGGTPGFVANVDFTPGTTVALMLSQAYGLRANLWVAFDGVEQGADQYSLSGNILTFTSPIPAGVNKVYVKGGTTLTAGTPANASVTDASIAPGSTLYQRMLQFISVKDPQFGAVGNGVTDDTAAIQAALNYISSNGGSLYFPTGNYKVSGSGLTLNLGSITDNQNIHCQLIGAGSGATQIYYTGTGAALTVEGSNPNGLNTYLKIEDMRFLGTNASSNSSIGIQLTLCSMVIFRNVVSRIFGLGMNCTDVLQSAFYDCSFSANGGGVDMNYSTFSDPNAILFCNCEFASNLNFAALLGNPTTVTFLGGAIQGNGLTGIATYRYGVAVIANNGVGLNGALAASFIGVYFEGNAFQADIWFQAGGNVDGPTGLTVMGCTFNRITGTANLFVDYNIELQVQPSNKVKLTMIGNGFNGFNTYTPSNTTPYVYINDPSGASVDMVDYGNLYGSNLEKPVALGPVKSDKYTVSMAVTFDGTASSPTAKYSYNVASITKNSTGVYTIVFQKNIDGLTNYPVAISTNGAVYQEVNSAAANAVTITLGNVSGTPTDFSYVSIMVFGAGDL